MKKDESEDKLFFDKMYLETFKTTLMDRDKLTEEEIVQKYREFDENNPLDIYMPEHCIFIAEDNEKNKVGLIWLMNRQPFWRFKERLIWIYNLHVIPDFRGQGLARKLLKKAEEWADRQGLDTIALHVYENNKTARQLYESLDYTHIETDNESCIYEKKLN